MNVINLLIKPASSSCNLRCKYCFYLDIAENREVASFGKMQYDTLERIIKEAFEANPKAVVFAFQGGEPTLVGLSFYEEAIKLIGQYNPNKIPVSFSIQTNGVLLDSAWCEFFNKNDFLVGISLDGPKFVHNRNRVDKDNNGTFIKVINNIELLKKHQVAFNILTVVNNDLVRDIEKVYHYFKSHGFKYLQFIPCLAEIGENQEKTLSQENYEIFLNNLFDLWYQDIMNGIPISIRYFDNLIGIIMGYQPQSCDLSSQCSNNLIIESNGDIYPCDFYVLDQYKIGNIKDGLKGVFENNRRHNFINESKLIPDDCRNCKFYVLCKGGCRKHKELNNEKYLNYFCPSYLNFFNKNIRKLEQLAFRLQITG